DSSRSIYRVYRIDSEHPGETLIAEVSGRLNISVLDRTALEGQPYYYYVVPVQSQPDSKGNRKEGAESERVFFMKKESRDNDRQKPPNNKQSPTPDKNETPSPTDLEDGD
ncbi:MAG: hypothetical protein ACOYJD_06005, partial [Christensenellales bacterium]